MKEWLLANGITHVAMESTGVYWKPVMRVLEADIPNVWIVNARHIKDVTGHKTDKMDSEWISIYASQDWKKAKALLDCRIEETWIQS